MDKFNKIIYEIVEKTASNKITIFTDKLKIDGYIYKCNNKCKEVAENILTLNNAIVCKLDDYCSCDENKCECNDFVCLKYNWLNVLHSQIVAFTLIFITRTIIIQFTNNCII